MALSKDAVMNIIYFVGFLDLFGVSMIIPLLPKHAKELGASPTIIGLIGSVYGCLQLFSSPVVGRWSDHAGRRFVLLLCLLCTSVGYGMLAMATSVFLLFLARIPCGIFKQNQDLSRGYLTHLLPPQERSRSFGHLNAISNIGFIVGPAVGGHLADWTGGFYVIATLTTSIFVTCTGLFKHTQNLSKCLVNDMVVGGKAATLGRYNAISATAFIIGPILSGHLMDTVHGIFWVYVATGGIFILNAVIVWLFVPEVDTHQYKKTEDWSEQVDSGMAMQDEMRTEIPANTGLDKQLKPMPSEVPAVKSEKATGSQTQASFLSTFAQFDWTNLWDVFLVRFLMGFAVIVYRSNFSLMLNEKFDASGKTVGYLISYGGIVGTVSGFAVGHISRWYNNDAKMLLHTGIIQLVTILSLTFSPNLSLLIIALAPLSLANAVARVGMTNLTIKRGGNHDTGALLGLGASVLSVARMLSPFIAGLAQEAHMSGPGVLGSISAGFGVLIMFFSPKFSRPKLKSE